jgi:small acid-soluble spore protein D (minor alpha/beta-type SASP)
MKFKLQKLTFIKTLQIRKIGKQTQSKDQIKFKNYLRSVLIMASNKNVVPEAREALNKFKMEAASEVGVNLKQGYNGDLTSREAGSVGGQMVKSMIKSYEQGMK